MNTGSEETVETLCFPQLSSHEDDWINDPDKIIRETESENKMVKDGGIKRKVESTEDEDADDEDDEEDDLRIHVPLELIQKARLKRPQAQSGPILKKNEKKHFVFNLKINKNH